MAVLLIITLYLPINKDPRREEEGEKERTRRGRGRKGREGEGERGLKGAGMKGDGRARGDKKNKLNECS